MDSPMLEQLKPSDSLVEAVREASRSAKLITLDELCSVPLRQVPKESGTSESLADGPEPSYPSSAVDAESLIAEAEAEDIKLMRGNVDVYCFSDRYMTAPYALHLFRVAEKDPARLVADTVRDESRIYPRPTPVSVFTDHPFNIPKAQLEGVLWQLTQRDDMQDIKRTTASNGDLYLYSSQHLSDALAESLAEWDAVGCLENP